MDWEYERPNIVITWENIDELENTFKFPHLFPGLKDGNYYIISSSRSKYTYGVCSAKEFFSALREVMKDVQFKSSKDREVINHWRWYPRLGHYANEENPRSEGGSIVHFYTSRDLDKNGNPKEDFTRLSEMNQNTKDCFASLKANEIKTFSRGGSPFKKLGIGIMDDLWWCDGNGDISFSSRDSNRIILKI
jgi:hypothetical protein